MRTISYRQVIYAKELAQEVDFLTDKERVVYTNALIDAIKWGNNH